jgi:hypothetical protein
MFFRYKSLYLAPCPLKGGRGGANFLSLKKEDGHDPAGIESHQNLVAARQCWGPNPRGWHLDLAPLRRSRIGRNRTSRNLDRGPRRWNLRGLRRRARARLHTTAHARRAPAAGRGPQAPPWTKRRP